ncbi:MAG: tetratricopeptide repeat protein [Planctomycetota bacterium]|jgi:tetratricopeptide (TPR) repeat protein
MKSEHRHELKTNELAEWLMNFPNWFKENLNMIIYVSAGILIIFLVFGYIWYTRNVQTVEQKTEFTNAVLAIPEQKTRIINDQMRGSDSSYVLLQSANELKLIAQNSREDGMAALAFIKNAEILRTELHYRPRAVTQAEKRRQINNAKNSYNKAIEKSASIPSLRASAQYGLGLCEEELSNFTEARKIYEDIINNTEFEGTTGTAQAKLRLKEMDNYQQRLVFKSRPTVAPPLVPEAASSNLTDPGPGINLSEVNTPNL